MPKRTAIALLLLVAISAVQADESKVTTLSKREFAEYETQVNRDLKENERYSEITAADLQTVKRKLATIDELYRKTDSAGHLAANDVNAIESNLGDVDRILHSAAIASHEVCVHEALTGTHIADTICRTQAQMQRDEEDADAALSYMQRPNVQATSGH
jgi:hypothetical protein